MTDPRATLKNTFPVGQSLEAQSLLWRRQIAPEVFLLGLTREGAFRPGQTVGITTDRRIPPRNYSIATGREDQWIEVLFDLVPAGLLTPRLAALAEGDRLFVRAPFGTFLDEQGPSIWIATGTGVAPFASMVRSGLSRDKVMIHGSRTLAGLHFQELFSEHLGNRYVPCCTAEEGPGVFRGRLTAWLAEHELPLTARYMVCGSAAMVVEVRDLLIARGVPFQKILAEIYF